MYKHLIAKVEMVSEHIFKRVLSFHFLKMISRFILDKVQFKMKSVKYVKCQFNKRWFILISRNQEN